MTSDEHERERARDGSLTEGFRPASTIWVGQTGTRQSRALVSHLVDLSLIGAMQRAAVEGR